MSPASPKTRTGATLADRLAGPLHGRARQPRRHRRAARHPRGPRRHAAVARVDDQRLHARVRGHAHPGRGARRSLRPSPAVPHRPFALHRVERRRGAGADHRRARRRPRPAGRRRRDRRPADPHAAGRRVPGEPPRRRAGHLVGHQRHRRGPRADRRRRRRRRDLMALDLLDQRPDRAGPAACRGACAAREPRPVARASTCPASAWSRSASSRSSSASSAGRPRAGRRR